LYRGDLERILLRSTQFKVKCRIVWRDAPRKKRGK
jgi:hypothetical protein